MQTYDMILFKKKRLVLTERELMNNMNTMTEQTGIWSRFKTAVLPSYSKQSNIQYNQAFKSFPIKKSHLETLTLIYLLKVKNPLKCLQMEYF